MPTMIVRQPKKRRRLKVQNLVLLVAFCSFCLWIYSSLFLKNNNVNLNVSIQTMQQEVVNLKNENESLKLDIRELASYENVSRIARDANLETSRANVFALTDANGQ